MTFVMLSQKWYPLDRMRSIKHCALNASSKHKQISLVKQYSKKKDWKQAKIDPNNMPSNNAQQLQWCTITEGSIGISNQLYHFQNHKWSHFVTKQSSMNPKIRKHSKDLQAGRRMHSMTNIMYMGVTFLMRQSTVYTHSIVGKNWKATKHIQLSRERWDLIF